MKRTSKTLLSLMAVLAVSATAQNLSTSSGSLANELLKAQNQIMLAVPAVASKEVAEALRVAALERGVKVFVMVDQSRVRAPSSYTVGLSMLPGVAVKIYRGLNSHTAIIDNHTLLRGGGLGNGSGFTLTRQAGEVAKEYSRLLSLWNLNPRVWKWN